MSDRAPRVGQWVRGLFRERGRSLPRFLGVEARATSRALLGMTEALASEAIVRTSVDDHAPGAPATHAFDRPVEELTVGTPQEAMARASGLALAGRRAAVFIPAGRFQAVVDPLHSAVARHVPLVCHTNDRPITDTGAFFVHARNAQQALDLALAARRVAELSLTPGVVATDLADTARALSDVHVPERELIREFLGNPEDEIECPTAAQSLLFGEHRRRVPVWFDVDRPTAHGIHPGDRELDAALAGRRAFFAGHVGAILDEALAELGGLVGRPLSSCHRYLLDDARYVIVAQGSAVEIAEAVADHVRQHAKLPVGVLGITVLRPFPADAVRAALEHARTVTVLDRTHDAARGVFPLLREIRSALQDRPIDVLSATYERLTAAQLGAVCENMKAGTAARRAVQLDVAPPSSDSEYPRRQILHQRLRRDYPELEQAALPVVQPLDIRPKGSCTASLHLRAPAFPETTLDKLGDRLVDAKGPHVRGRSTMLGPGLWKLCVTVAPGPLTAPGDDAPVDLALVACVDPHAGTNPLRDVVRGGTAVFATERDADDLWAELPRSWRETVACQDLTLFVIHGGSDELIASIEPLLRGEPGEIRELDWRELAAAPSVHAELPLAVRRFERTDLRYDSVPRFWGEFAEPRRDGESIPPVADPYLALGVVPPCTATFHDMTAQRDRVPQIDPAACTGCGKCWTSCPDSAIGPLAIGTETLLSTLADRAEPRQAGAAQDPAAGKLRRAFKQLAGRIDGRLVKEDARVLTPQIVQASFDWLVDKMNVGEDDRPGMRQAFEALLARMRELPLSVTGPFFREPHAEQKGRGELLMLAVNPQACQGCGVCAEVCPDDAIRTQSQTPASVEAMARVWQAWEQLPDTSGATIARVVGHADVGALASVLLSRHCLFSVAGGDGAEPGSGERLATRQVAAVVEYQMQRRTIERAEELSQLQERLAERIREQLAQATRVEDLEHLDAALDDLPRQVTHLGDVLERLEGLGERTDVDAPKIRLLVRTARRIEQERVRSTEGEHGVGRARYGLVVAGRSAAEWAAAFPRNPFSVPLTVDLAGDGPDLALGILEGMLAARVDEVRFTRLAELLLEDPPDLPVKQRELEALTRHDLSREELAPCPPLLVLGGSSPEDDAQLAGLSRLLTSDLPVKVLLLDDGDLLSRAADPVLLALAHRRAFVLSTSIAHADHLFDGVTDALKFAGPALIRIHAPSPLRHGFDVSIPVERARSAVSSRVIPLLRYDPAQPGTFGSRISLQGNPAVDRPWVRDDAGQTLTPAHWAVGESRFAKGFARARESAGEPIDRWLLLSPDEAGSRPPTVPGPNGGGLFVGDFLASAVRRRAERWAMLQELAGVVTPFTADVRSLLEQELGLAHRAEMTALKAEYESKLQEARRTEIASQGVRLRERLLQLAGYGVKRP